MVVRIKLYSIDSFVEIFVLSSFISLCRISIYWMSHYAELKIVAKALFYFIF